VITRLAHGTDGMFRSLGPGAVGIDLPFPEAAELAADTGFDGISVDAGYLHGEGPEAYSEILSEHGLETGSVGLPVALDADEDDYEDDLAALSVLAERASAIGCERCSTWIPSWSDERPFDENFAFYRRRLERPAAILDDHGIDLGLEFLGPRTLREGHEYEFVHTAEGMLELADAVGTDNVGLLLDCWHWHTSGGDVATLESLSADDVVDVHVNDAPAGLTLDEYVDDDRRLPGETGAIDIGPFLRELDRMGYEGPVMVEPFSDELPDLPPEEAAERTLRSLDRIWETAGL